MEKVGHFWFSKVGYQRQIREKERGTERNFVHMISGTRSVPRSCFEKRNAFPFRSSKKVERVPKALRAYFRFIILTRFFDTLNFYEFEPPSFILLIFCLIWNLTSIINSIYFSYLILIVCQNRHISWCWFHFWQFLPAWLKFQFNSCYFVYFTIFISSTKYINVIFFLNYSWCINRIW